MLRSIKGSLAVSALVALALVAGCSDDDTPTGGGPADTTPPEIASVNAIDNSHVEVVFNENVQRGTAEVPGNYTVAETIPPIAIETRGGLDTLQVWSATLGTDQRSVSLIILGMNPTSYDLTVTGVKDASGNVVAAGTSQSFAGSSNPDVTPPALVYRSPAPGATGVPVGTQILMTFSDAIDGGSFFDGFTLTGPSGPVPFDGDSQDNGVHIVAFPINPLTIDTEYTVSLDSLMDQAGNVMPSVNWSFRTTSVVDNTPPTVVSTVPANYATNVDVNSSLSMTFSEPVKQLELQISSYPDLGDGTLVWSNDGKTLTYTPDVPLATNQQYTLTLIPGGIEDLAGNPNTQSFTLRFSTGSTFAQGSIAGTVTGDSGSNAANDPTGAHVIVAAGDVTTLDDLVIAGSAVVADNNTYTVTNLNDGTYSVIGIMDSNGDGRVLSPGDAWGGYGIDIDSFDVVFDSVAVSGGENVAGIDFELFDYGAIAGTISYSGLYASEFHSIGIGLFPTAGFDPLAEPAYAVDRYWPDYLEWVFESWDGIPDGSYYVGAYIDANDNDTYDPGVDPSGFYGTPITMANDDDTIGIVIPLADPPISAPSRQGVAWTATKKRPLPTWWKSLAEATEKLEARKQW